ncbi:F-box/kelch-repeat protein SKIP6 [Acorus gramineus]|uniref:F-box/kelch-repeat protein SKIP6 n=1 Tax=Acorus gramineus TaxID=55184 RepID=A0AAV9AR18_ACOGR|nr:F-box/kelch-repeat protein SKIP6 [Acorus gramineus]
MSTSDEPTKPLLPGLPDEVAITCIARVPRLFHSNLSLVSRSWHSLLRSNPFFTVRSQINASQRLLLLNIVTTHISFSQWYITDPSSTRPTNLRPLPPSPSPHTLCSASVSIGPTLYLLGGSLHGVAQNAVWVFDARVNRWSAGPTMATPRTCAAGAVVDGKIHVFGGCTKEEKPWAEVLEPGAGDWAAVVVTDPAPALEWRARGKALVVDGRIYSGDRLQGLCFDPAREVGASWEVVQGWHKFCAKAAMDGLIYGFFGRRMKAYDVRGKNWRVVKGLERMPWVVLAEVGGGRLIGVRKVEERWRGKEAEIAVAVIEVEVDDRGVLRGKITRWADTPLALSRWSTSVPDFVTVEL